ncbi:hypothetical protein NE237_011305 [Protea cynaroides]|uniref:Uncharacterized protein n=1 Tax=Protea cynaroides TaxID=273540 RepID=A0A9Q0GYW0_9MAGN|nr:hypothetical protein NE237_011305 [Protea cynaroides]
MYSLLQSVVQAMSAFFPTPSINNGRTAPVTMMPLTIGSIASFAPLVPPCFHSIVRVVPWLDPVPGLLLLGGNTLCSYNCTQLLLAVGPFCPEELLCHLEEYEFDERESHFCKLVEFQSQQSSALAHAKKQDNEVLQE